MPLCFIEPQEAIRVVAESVGREARRQLLSEVVSAWVDEIPDDELVVHYSKAVDDLDDDDLSMLAAWHASLEVGQPIANKEFLLGASTASASTGARRSRSPRASAATRRSRTASPRSRRSTRSCRGCPRTARWSSPPKRSSCTAGTAWAARTSASPSRHRGRSRRLRRLVGAGRASPSFDGGYARVTQGDRRRHDPPGRARPVRLIGIDTPEVYGDAECFGRQASIFAKRLLPLGTRVRYRVGVEERDRYGRLLAYVWLPDGGCSTG